jgi:hypothetical protein
MLHPSGIGLEDHATLETIPDPVVKPSFNPPKGLKADNCAVLVYDLETIGLSKKIFF